MLHVFTTRAFQVSAVLGIASVLAAGCGGGSGDNSKSAAPRPSKKVILQAMDDFGVVSLAASHAREDSTAYDLDFENVGSQIVKDPGLQTTQGVGDYATVEKTPVSFADLDKLKPHHTYLVTDHGDYQLVILEPLGGDWYMLYREGRSANNRYQSTAPGDAGPFHGDELKDLVTKKLTGVDCSTDGTAPGC